MRTSVLVGLAGAALCTSAFAQEKTLNPVQMVPVNRASIMKPTYVGGNVPAYSSRSVGPAPVYDNQGFSGGSIDGSKLDYFFYFGTSTTGQTGQICDTTSLHPGKGSTLNGDGNVIMSCHFLVLTFTAGITLDVLVTPWDLNNKDAVAPASAFENVCAPGAFYITWLFGGAGVYELDYDVSGLGGIVVPDGGVHIALGSYVADQTFTVQSGPTDLTPLYNSSNNWGETGFNTNLDNGASAPWIYIDTNLDNVNANNERYRVGDAAGNAGWMKWADLCCTLQGDARCDADYDNNGFVEPIDYNLFINAFEAGPCPV